MPYKKNSLSLIIFFLFYSNLAIALGQPKKILVALNYNYLTQHLDLKDYDVYYLYTNNPLDHLSLSKQCKVSSYRNQNEIENCIEKLSSGTLGYFDSLLVGVYDKDAAIGGRMRDKFGIKNGIQKGSALSMTNKFLMKKKLVENNSSYLIPSITNQRMIYFDTIRDFFRDHKDSGIVIKPEKGTASMGVEIIKSEEKLEKLFAEVVKDTNKSYLYGYVVEKFISGPVTFMDGYVYNGQLKVLIPAQEHILPTEFYTLGKVDRVESKIEETADYFPHVQQIISDLEYKSGIFHLEMIGGESASEKYFLEIGPRPGEANEDAYKHLGFREEKAYFMDQMGLEFTDLPPGKIENCYFQLYFPSLGGSKYLGTTQRVVKLKLPEVGGFVKSINIKKDLLEKPFATSNLHIKTLFTIVFAAEQSQKSELKEFVMKVQKDLEDPAHTLLEVVKR